MLDVLLHQHCIQTTPFKLSWMDHQVQCSTIQNSCMRTCTCNLFLLFFWGVFWRVCLWELKQNKNWKMRTSPRPVSSVVFYSVVLFCCDDLFVYWQSCCQTSSHTSFFVLWFVEWNLVKVVVYAIPLLFLLLLLSFVCLAFDQRYGNVGLEFQWRVWLARKILWIKQCTSRMFTK